MTVSELIKSIASHKTNEQWPDGYRLEQHWISCLKDELYNGGFNEANWDSEGCDLDTILSGAFHDALRQLYKFVPVLVTDDPEDAEA